MERPPAQVKVLRELPGSEAGATLRLCWVDDRGYFYVNDLTDMPYTVEMVEGQNSWFKEV